MAEEFGLVKMSGSDRSMYGVLRNRLKAHERHGVGSPALYSTLMDASNFIVALVEDNGEEQEALRESGVAHVLVDAWVAVFQSHLEGQTSPMSYGSWMECWKLLSSAVWVLVDKPRNEKNQELVLSKILGRKGNQLMQFLVHSARSIEIITESYVIPILRLLKSLITDNVRTQEMLGSQNKMVIALVDAFKARIESKKSVADSLLWVSIDSLAWILSIVFQYNNANTAKIEEEDCVSSSSGSALSKKMCELVNPCCLFLDASETNDKPTSVGTLLLLVSIFTRSLESVHRFNISQGNDLIVKIHGSCQSPAVKDAADALMRVLSIQNKQMRQGNPGWKDNQSESSKNSSGSFQYGGQNEAQGRFKPSPRGYSADENKTEDSSPQPSDKKASQVESDKTLESSSSVGPKKNWIDNGPDLLTAWIRSLKDVEPVIDDVDDDMDLELEQLPSASSKCMSEFDLESSISKYAPSNVSMLRKRSYMSSVSSTMHAPPHVHHNRGVPRPPTFCGSVVPDTPVFKKPFAVGFSSEYGGAPGKRLRMAGRPATVDDDHSSMISISLPRNGFVKEKREISEGEVTKILSDLRPCNIMETDDHLVIFCTSSPPSKVAAHQISISPPVNFNSIRNKQEADSNSEGGKGYVKSFWNWMFK